MKNTLLKRTLLTIPILLLLVLSVSATSIYSNQFEEGDFSGWDNNSSSANANIAVQDSTVWNGSYALRAEIEATGGEWAVVVEDFTASQNVSVSAYVKYFSDMGDTVQNKFLELRNGSTTLAYIGLRNVGGLHKWVLRYRNSSSESNSIETNVLPSEDSWYHVELMVNCSSADGTTDGAVNVWIDDVLLDCSVDNLDTDYTQVSRLEAGNANGESINFIDFVRVQDQYIGAVEETTTDLFRGNAVALIAIALAIMVLVGTFESNLFRRQNQSGR